MLSVSRGLKPHESISLKTEDLYFFLEGLIHCVFLVSHFYDSPHCTSALYFWPRYVLSENIIQIYTGKPGRFFRSPPPLLCLSLTKQLLSRNSYYMRIKDPHSMCPVFMSVYSLLTFHFHMLCGICCVKCCFLFCAKKSLGLLLLTLLWRGVDEVWKDGT